MRLPTADQLQGVDTAGLYAWLDTQRAQMLADLADYTSHETPSTDKPCLQAGLTWLQGWLTRRLGAPADTRVVDGGRYGDIFVADYPGAGDRPVVLLCHYDTVWDKGTLDDWPFAIADDHASGPGVFDMKAGLVQAVWALRAHGHAGTPRPWVRLLLNGDEEIGNPASRPVIEEVCQNAAAVLVFEPSADGAVKTARKGVGIYRITVHGVEAHAGLDPDKGASAVKELARVVLDLHDLANSDAGTTVNVGLARGGTRSNVVPGYAMAEVDVRTRSSAEAHRIERAIHALEPSDHRVRLTVTGEWNRPVMERTKPIADMYALARTLAASIGVDLREAAVGGGSDGSYAAVRGLPVLDGFGAVGDGAHARHEHVTISGMAERSALAAAVLHALALTC